MGVYFKEDNGVLYQGDCLEVMKMIPDKKIDLLVTDPPYKTTSRGSHGGTGGMCKSELFKSGNVFKNNNIAFKEWLPEVYRILKDDAHVYIMTNNKNLINLSLEIEKAGFNIYKTLIWSKNTAITNMWYMDSHEYIIFCRKGKAKKINNCGSKSVLFFDNPKNKLHPTEKPVDLMSILINNSSVENDIVFDPFVGSGSTVISAKNLNRKYIGIELEEEYCEISKKRLLGEI